MRAHTAVLSFAVFFLSGCPLPLWAADVSPSWIARYNGPKNHHDRGTTLALDGSGHVYVAGATVAADGYRRCTTIKYGSDGRTFWVADHNPGWATGIVVDTNADVYVAGVFDVLGYQDYLVEKHDSNGTQIWASAYDDGYFDHPDHAAALVLTPEGQLLVGGSSQKSFYVPVGLDDRRLVHHWDHLVVRFGAATGDYEALARYTGPTNDSSDFFAAMTTDAVGNIYVVGTSQYWSSPYLYSRSMLWELVTVKYASDGTTVWVAREPMANGPVPAGAGIALDDLGNVYVVGGPLVKYDANGNRLWGFGTNGEVRAATLALDSKRNVLAAGQSRDGALMTLKCNTDGSLLWIRSSAPTNGAALSIDVDAADHAYVAGRWGSIPESQFPEPGHRLAILKFDDNGFETFRWFGVPGLPNAPSAAASVKVDGHSSAYVVGYASGSGGNADCVTIKLDPRALPDLTVAEDTGPHTLSFDLGYLEVNSTNLLIEIHSESPHLIPNDFELLGSGTTRTLWFKTATNRNGLGAIRVRMRTALGDRDRWFRVAVAPVNDSPSATIKISGPSFLYSLTNLYVVVAPDNGRALVNLKAAAIADVEGDSLTHAWFVNASTTPFSTQPHLTRYFGVGTREIKLRINDGLAQTDVKVNLSVIPVSTLIRSKISKITQKIGARPITQTPLRHLEKSALAFEAGDPLMGRQQLERARASVNAIVLPYQPQVAQYLLVEIGRILQLL